MRETKVTGIIRMPCRREEGLQLRVICICVCMQSGQCGVFFVSDKE